MRTFKKALLALLCLAFTATTAIGCLDATEDSTPAMSTPTASTPDESTAGESTVDESVTESTEEESVADSVQDSTEGEQDSTENPTPVVTYVVEFKDAETGATLADSVEFTEETIGEVVFPEVPAEYQKTGYTVAWNKTPADLTPENCVVSLAAPVANTYQITYDANGGSAVEAQTVTYDGAYTVAEAPTLEYYEFQGWYVVEDGAMTETKLESGEAWNIASDVTVQAKWTIIEGEYAMKYVFNVQDNPITQITKQAYAGGSEVSFKYYIPEGTQAGWWGIAWHTDATQANNYHAAGAENAIGYYDLPQMVGSWVNVKFTLPEGGEYYLYFGAEVNPNNKWMVGENNSYALIDNFKIGDVTEDFNSGLRESIFQVNVANAVTLGEGYYFERGEYAMKYVFNVQDNPITQITKQAYAGGSEVSFKYYLPEGTQAGWWGIAWHTDASKANNYHAAGAENPIGFQALGAMTGVWVDVKFTLPEGGEYYLYFGAEVDSNKWVLNGGNPYALIDDFKIGDVTEDFNGGLDESIFEVNVANAVTLGEGYVKPVFEEGEYAMKYVFNVSGETVSQVTKKAYPAGSKVSFKYFIPVGVNTKWWGICWSKSNTGLDIYAAASTASAYPLTAVVGAWMTVEFTLPEGDGEYYLYFGSEVGNWKFADGSNAYVLIDDFTVGTETENFNKPLEENGMFEILVPGTVVISDKDAGYAEKAFEEGEYAMKYVFNVSGETVSQVTKKAYAAGSKVSFKYYIPEGVNARWWGICWSKSNTGLDIYAAATNASAYPLTAVVGAWTTVEFTLPEGDGEYYLYFGSEVGNWKFADGSNAYVLIDDFTVGTETENFNKPLEENGMFEILVPGAVTLGKAD